MRLGQRHKRSFKQYVSKPRFSKHVYSNYNEIAKNHIIVEPSAVYKYDVEALPYFDEVSFASYLGLPVDLLESITYDNSRFNYSKFYIDKHTGKIVPYSSGLDLREINSPYPGLKEIQTALIPLFMTFPKHPCNHAFIEGKNIKTAAESVCDGKLLIHADLVHFFDEHTSLYIKRKLFTICKASDIQLSAKFVDLITRVTCKDNKLPQGSPCSPILTIILNYELDARIQKVAEKYNLGYSRYADDLWFTGDLDNGLISNFRTDLSEAVHPFRLNYRKFGVMKETAYPVLRGATVICSAFTLPSHKGKMLEIIKSKLEGFEIKPSSTGKDINLEFNKVPELPLEDVKALFTDIEATINKRYTKVQIKIKPKFFYVQAVKHCLGMNIKDRATKYPRKEYNKMRLYAYLVGKQKALQNIALVAKKCNLDSSFVTRFATMDRKVNLGAKSAIPYRNLLKYKFNMRVFSGKVNFMRQVDANKAEKIDHIVSHTERLYIERFKEFISSTIGSNSSVVQDLLS